MHVAASQYGYYFAAFLMGSENATTTTSSNMNNTVNPERPVSSNLVASNPASASAKIGELTKWREEQSSVLVDEWKELRIEEVESSRATETWRQILNAVNKA